MKTKSNSKRTILRELTVDGMMTFGELGNGLHVADFACCEDVEIAPFTAKCKVQAMRDGNVYVSELPKRIRNKPIFRDDNCSLSLGRDGRYYFVFSLPQELVDELPQRMTCQAGSLAKKVIREIIFGRKMR